MDNNLPPACPKCESIYTYYDGISNIVCPECAYEFKLDGAIENSVINVIDDANNAVIKDVNGNILNDGDTVIIIKDLPVKGMSKPIKSGTKVKNIRLNPYSANDHDIDAKVDGFGAMSLKSSVVKKA